MDEDMPSSIDLSSMDDDAPDIKGIAPLEQELRAALAPVKAPAAFRERLRADLVYAQRRSFTLGADSTGFSPRPHFDEQLNDPPLPRRLPVPLRPRRSVAPQWLTPRTVMTVTAIAAAVVVLATVASNTFPSFRSTTPPSLVTVTPRPAMTATPHPTVAQTIAAPRRQNAAKTGEGRQSSGRSDRQRGTAGPSPSIRPTDPSAPSPTRPSGPLPTPTARPADPSPTAPPADPSPAPTTAAIAAPPRTQETTTPIVVATPSEAPTPVPPAATSSPAPRSTAVLVATPSPIPTGTSIAPVATATSTEPSAPTATLAPVLLRPTVAPSPTVRLSTPTLAPSPTRRPLTPTPSSTHPKAAAGRRPTPPRPTPAIVLPALSIHIPLPPRPKATSTMPPTATEHPTTAPRATSRPSATVTPSPRATSRPASTVTPSPTSTATASSTTAPSPTPTATKTVAPTATATATPTATSRPIVQNPLVAVSLPVPNPNNGLLGSPLDAAMAVQPNSYAITPSLALTLTPASLLLTSPTLAVYPLTATVATSDAVAPLVASIGGHLDQSEAPLYADGAISTNIHIGAVPYTVTLSTGYAGPWFDVQQTPADRLSQSGQFFAARLAAQAQVWLRIHGLWRPDLHLKGIEGGDAVYDQIIGGFSLLGTDAVRLGFDARGVLRHLSWRYVATGAVSLKAAQTPNIAISQQLADGEALYVGPNTADVSGQAVLDSLILGYTGVHGATGDYLEPLYVVGGTAPTAGGAAPITLYASALDYTNQ